MSNRYTTGNSPTVLAPFEHDPELRLRDEERSWILNPYRYGYCPECGDAPYLYQRPNGFRLGCRDSQKGKCSGPWNTPWLPSSKEACNVWRMSRMLSGQKNNS